MVRSILVRKGTRAMHSPSAQVGEMGEGNARISHFFAIDRSTTAVVP